MMQVQKEALPDIQDKDKLLLQRVIVPNGTTTKDITSKMFDKQAGHIVEEFILRVAYIPANPSSPVLKSLKRALLTYPTYLLEIMRLKMLHCLMLSQNLLRYR